MNNLEKQKESAMELEREKQEVLNIQQNFYEKLFEKFRQYEIEINRYKEKLNLANEEITKLKVELKIDKDEKEKNQNIIKELREEIRKLDDEIYQLKHNDTSNKIEIIEDLKEAFIHNNEEDIEEIIDKILENIVEIEEILTFEEIIFLMYICYFTDRLKVLLDKSQVANILYDGDSKESKLLKILVQEENCKVSSTIEECTRGYMCKQTDIFSTLEKKIVKRIKETIEDFSYKSFEEAYDSAKIKKDDKVVLSKAWVRHEGGVYWKLVSGLYSVANNKIYLEKRKIEILGLKEGELEGEKIEKINLHKNKVDILDDTRALIKYHINLIKNRFLLEKPEKIKTLMRSTKSSPLRNMFDDILVYEIISDTITKKEAYTLLLISLFYGVHNKLIENSSYLKELYESQASEGQLLRILDCEIRINDRSQIDLPVRVFLERDEIILIHIDNAVRLKAIELIKAYFNKEFKEIVVSNKQYIKCINDGKQLVIKRGYIKLANELDESKYILCSDMACNVCETLYIKNKRYKKINAVLNSYSIKNINLKVINKNSVINTSEDKNTINIKYIEDLYKELLNYFNEDNLGFSLLTFNKIIESKNELKYLTNMQAITLRFIGYLIKNNTFGAAKIQTDNTIGIVPESEIYERMTNGVDFRGVLEKNRNNLKFIDPIVRTNIINRLMKLNQDTGKIKFLSSNNEDFNSVNLNTESDIKKLGYSTALSREERWKILKNKAIPKLGKNKVIGHIKFLIKMNKSRKVMENAVNEWVYDLDRLYRL